MASLDVIVIGGGINSLVTAVKLGKIGKKVVVFEARDHIGGLAETSEFANGFTCNMLNDHINGIDPRLEKEFDLISHGLKMSQPDPIRIALDKDGNHIRFYQDVQKTTKSITIHSEKDAGKWSEFNTHILRLIDFLKTIYQSPPPDLPQIGFSDLTRLKSLFNPMMKQGTTGLAEFMRTMPMMMPELMDEWFESDLLRGAISAQAVKNLSQGPYASATVLNLLHHHIYSDGVMQNVHIIDGGTNQYAEALMKICRSFGTEVCLAQKVESIITDNGCCKGVQLSNGEKIIAEEVVSGLDPRNTFHRLTGHKNVSPEFNRQINNIKFRGSTARIHLALSGLPEMNGISPEEMSAIFTIAPSINYIEKAFDNTKYGRISEKPVIEFSIPSLLNPSFCEQGKHVLSITVQYAPYHLRNAKWDEHHKDQLFRNTMMVCNKYMPEIESLIEKILILSPAEMEMEYGLTEGSLSHGELTLDQFWFMRPMIRSSQYQTPIKNLFLCGPGTHPGPGLHGANGLNAANLIYNL